MRCYLELHVLGQGANSMIQFKFSKLKTIIMTNNSLKITKMVSNAKRFLGHHEGNNFVFHISFNNL